MILFVIPSWAKALVVEFDATLWIHNNEHYPHKENIGTKSSYRAIYNEPVRSKLIGKVINAIHPGTTKIIDEHNSEPRFVDQNMDIVTKDNIPYKEWVLRQMLLNKHKEDKC